MRFTTCENIKCRAQRGNTQNLFIYLFALLFPCSSLALHLLLTVLFTCSSLALHLLDYFPDYFVSTISLTILCQLFPWLFFVNYFPDYFVSTISLTILRRLFPWLFCVDYFPKSLPRSHFRPPKSLLRSLFRPPNFHPPLWLPRGIASAAWFLWLLYIFRL